MIELADPSRNILFEKNTLVMGILNCTDDSFSGDGVGANLDTAIGKALKMVDEGADIIDIGGESTRPGAKSVSIEQEIGRVIPIIEKIRMESEVLISIDTTKSEVAERAILAGADIVNDISSMSFDPKIADVVVKYNVPIILMHIKGNPGNMQDSPEYENVIEEIKSFLIDKIEFLISLGIKKNKIIIDPGIGFGKSVNHNLEIINRLNEFKDLDKPILIGTSRKSFIGEVTNKNVDDRIGGTIASTLISVLNGAKIVRVHDVSQIKDCLDVTYSIQNYKVI